MYFIPYKANEFLENSFFQVPKELFVNPYYTDLILASKVLYGLLLDRLSLSIKNKWTDKDGDIYIIFSRKEAQDYINDYFKTYPKIKAFLDGLVSSAKEKGYAVSVFGRRRPVPELKASNFMQRSFGERVAMNSPIQGTAADIMKIAMNRVYARLMKEGLKSRLILQIHDELLIEAPTEEAEYAREILEEEMKGAANLSVALETDCHIGTDWYEAK